MAYSLEKRCLAVIEDNFDLYMAAYQCENYTILRLLEFLQKEYSSVLLYTMLLKGKLSDISYKFLICDHLKKLDLTYPNFCGTPFLILRLAEVGKNIRILNMDNKTEYSNVDIKKIVELVPNVEELNLSCTNADDDVMKVIGCNKTLHSLDISGCDISKAALKYLCEKDDKDALKPNVRLKRLCLTGRKKNVAFALMNFPSLEILEHFQLGKVLWDIYEDRYLKGILNISPKFNLTKVISSKYFSLEDTSEREFLVELLKRCPLLCPKIISLQVHHFTDHMTLQPYLSFTNLQEICLTSESKIDFSPILEALYSSLNQINFCNGIVSVDLLLKCHKVQKMVLSNVELQPITCSMSEAAFENLTSLTFKYIDLPEQKEMAMLLIKSSPNLQLMEFTKCENLSESFVECFCNCECIATLVELVLFSYETNLNDVLRILKFAKCLNKVKILSNHISYSDYESILMFCKVNSRRINVIYYNDPFCSYGYFSECDSCDLDSD